MGRSPCCDKVGLKKGPWTPEEDQKLLAYIEENGLGSWRALPAKAGLQRCGKSCRLRWTNYLRPDIKRGKFSLQEEQTIIQLHALLGNRWSAIATHLPKRTDNEIKNYWNTHLKKRLTKMGIDPVTHKPKTDSLGSPTKNSANLSHMAQWESARLEAEARLVRESKLLQATIHNQQLATKNPTQSSRLPCLDVLKAWQNSWLNSRPIATNSKDNNIYAMMFAMDDLESPTSTLSFSDNNKFSFPNVGLYNQNLLTPTTTTIPSTAALESWQYFTKQQNQVGENIMVPISGNEGSSWFENVIPVISDVVVEGNLNYNAELLCDDHQYSNLNDNKITEEEINGGDDGDGDVHGSSNVVSFEENNKNYWDTLLVNLINNDSLPVF